LLCTDQMKERSEEDGALHRFWKSGLFSPSKFLHQRLARRSVQITTWQEVEHGVGGRDTSLPPESSSESC